VLAVKSHAGGTPVDSAEQPFYTDPGGGLMAWAPCSSTAASSTSCATTDAATRRRLPPRGELEQVLKAHYVACQACAKPLRWVCRGCALVLSADTITGSEDPATGRIVARCNSCGADAWG
jgi:hypothetical protein